jgi:hypothetical protein
MNKIKLDEENFGMLIAYLDDYKTLKSKKQALTKEISSSESNLKDLREMYDFQFKHYKEKGYFHYLGDKYSKEDIANLYDWITYIKNVRLNMDDKSLDIVVSKFYVPFMGKEIDVQEYLIRDLGVLDIINLKVGIENDVNQDIEFENKIEDRELADEGFMFKGDVELEAMIEKTKDLDGDLAEIENLISEENNEMLKEYEEGDYSKERLLSDLDKIQDLFTDFSNVGSTEETIEEVRTMYTDLTGKFDFEERESLSDLNGLFAKIKEEVNRPTYVGDIDNFYKEKSGQYFKEYLANE